MANRRRYHRSVAEDIRKAVEYYDIWHRLVTVTERPESIGRVSEQVRAAMVEQFHYVIVFEHGGGTVFILGLFHASSDREQRFERSR